MAQYELVKSFDIDHGELDGLTPQECFVLGYELAWVDELLRQRPCGGFKKAVHSHNQERIRKSCKSRKFSLTYMDNDQSESWMWLKVEP